MLYTDVNEKINTLLKKGLFKEYDAYNVFPENTALGNTLIVVDDKDINLEKQQEESIKTIVIAGHTTKFPFGYKSCPNAEKLVVASPDFHILHLNNLKWGLKEIIFAEDSKVFVLFDEGSISESFYGMMNQTLSDESLFELVRRCPEIAYHVGYGRFSKSGFEPKLREAFLEGLLNKYHDGNIIESAVDEMLKEYQKRCFQLYSEGLTEEERIRIKCAFLFNECGKISEKKNIILSQRNDSKQKAQDAKEEIKDYRSSSRSKILMEKAKQ